MSRRFLQLLPALLLVLVQQAGIVHLASHSIERLTQEHGAGHLDDGYCIKCAVYASLGTTPPAAPLPFIAVSAPVFFVPVVAWTFTSRTTVAYQSRAPPAFL